MYHAWDWSQMHKNFQSEKLNGREHFADLGVNGRIILNWILRK